MQPEDEISSAQHPCADASTLGGGADSSNRPWETDALPVDPGGAPAAVGLLAVAGAALLTLADMALMAPSGAAHAWPPPDQFAELSRWRLLTGYALGVLLVPAYIPGYWLVFRGLRNAGGWLSWPVLVLGSYTAAVTGALHAMPPLIGLLARHGAADAATGGRLLAQARSFADPLHGVVNGLFVLTSLWFAAAVLSGRTLFPRALAAANPLLVASLLLLPSLAAPRFAPAALLAAASYNLAHLVFFALATASFPRRGL